VDIYTAKIPGGNLTANGHETADGGFRILPGSTMRKDCVKADDKRLADFPGRRAELIENGVVELRGDHYVFLTAHECSPSMAACIVRGNSSNGLDEWKLPDGRTLGDNRRGRTTADRLLDDVADLLDEYDPATAKDTRERILIEKARRDGQPKFRKQLLKAYNSKCAITGNRIEAVLVAAHIDPYKGEETNHISNGLLLSSDWHTLFDRHLITVDPETLCLLTCLELRGSIYESYKDKRITTPAKPSNRPSRKALEQHYQTYLSLHPA